LRGSDIVLHLSANQKCTIDMKKLILSLLACGSIIAANAQAGSVLVYGNVGVATTSDQSNAKELTWNVSPGVGYQFDNHWTGGIYAGYMSTGDKGAAAGSVWSKTNTTEVGLFGRYTHNLNRIFSIWGQLNAGWTHMNSTLDGEVVDGSRANGFAIGLTPAFQVNVYNGWALNFNFGGIGYKTYTYEHADNSNTDLNINFGKQFNWGISKNIGGHNHRIHREPGSDRHMKNYRDDDGDEPKKHKKSKANDDNDE
jgi:hypothetical protein